MTDNDNSTLGGNYRLRQPGRVDFVHGIDAVGGSFSLSGALADIALDPTMSVVQSGREDGAPAAAAHHFPRRQGRPLPPVSSQQDLHGLSQPENDSGQHHRRPAGITVIHICREVLFLY